MMHVTLKILGYGFSLLLVFSLLDVFVFNMRVVQG